MTELPIVYDESMRPVSATCKHCGQQMPAPEPTLESAPDIILWFSVKFLEHKNHEHPTLRKSDNEELAHSAWNPS